MPTQATPLPTLSESLASSTVTSRELLKSTVTSTPHVVISGQFVLAVAVPVGVVCAAIVVVLTAILITAVWCVHKINLHSIIVYSITLYIKCSMKLSKKKTAAMSNQREFENMDISKDSFKMTGFDNKSSSCKFISIHLEYCLSLT